MENVREGRICARCNNGWMSGLEQSCQGILLDMIRGRRQPGQLSETECLLVARWAAKTAYVLNSSANFTIKAPTTTIERAAREHSRPSVGSCRDRLDGSFCQLRLVSVKPLGTLCSRQFDGAHCGTYGHPYLQNWCSVRSYDSDGCVARNTRLVEDALVQSTRRVVAFERKVWLARRRRFNPGCPCTKDGPSGTSGAKN